MSYPTKVGHRGFCVWADNEMDVNECLHCRFSDDIEMGGVGKSTRTPLVLLVNPALKLRAPVLGVTVDLFHRDNS